MNKLRGNKGERNGKIKRSTYIYYLNRGIDYAADTAVAG